jgi:hypothetical protein
MHLANVNQKRFRRMEYAIETGTFPPAGWTPPDPRGAAARWTNKKQSGELLAGLFAVEQDDY